MVWSKEKRREYNRNYRAANKEKIKELSRNYRAKPGYKQKRIVSRRWICEEKIRRGPCKRCGETDPELLITHHPGKKNFDIGSYVGCQKELLLAEFDLTINLCRPCHGRHHEWMRQVGHIYPE